MEKSSLNLVDHEQRDAVQAFPSFDPDHDDISVFRTATVDGLTALLSPEQVMLEERFIPGRFGDPDVRLLIHRPPENGQYRPAILYFHGGGMIAGTPDMMAGAHEALARESETVIIAVDYRLAPETPFPGALEDAHAAIAWLFHHAAELNIDSSRIAVMGDSGGGGLAAAATLLARDRGTAQLRAQILVYPMLDIRSGTIDAPADDPLTGEFVWTRAQNRFAWRLVRGNASLSKKSTGYLSPALAEDLSSLPPALILVGALDLFRNESIDYAQRLLASGVPTDLIVYAGAVHGFDLLPGALTVRARADLLNGIHRLLHD